MFVSFHPLVQDEVDNTVVERFQPGPFMNACYTVSSDYPTQSKSYSFHPSTDWAFIYIGPYTKNPADFGLERLATAFMNSPGYGTLINSRPLFVEPCCGPLPAPEW